MFKILNGFENIARNIFSRLRNSERLEDIELYEQRSSVDYTLDNANFHKEQYMNGTDYQLIVYMLVLLRY